MRNRLLWKCATLLAAATLLAGILPPCEAGEDRSALSVAVTDQLGRPIDAQVEVVERSIKKAGKAAGKPARFEVGYGEYWVTAYASGFRKAEKRVRVYAPEVLAVISLDLGSLGDRPYTMLEGSITGLKNMPPGSLVYVRLIPVFGQIEHTSPVDAEGRFALKEFARGAHLLLVIGDGKILANRKIDLIKDLERVDIALRPDGGQ